MSKDIMSTSRMTILQQRKKLMPYKKTRKNPTKKRIRKTFGLYRLSLIDYNSTRNRMRIGMYQDIGPKLSDSFIMTFNVQLLRCRKGCRIRSNTHNTHVYCRVLCVLCLHYGGSEKKHPAELMQMRKNTTEKGGEGTGMFTKSFVCSGPQKCRCRNSLPGHRLSTTLTNTTNTVVGG